eukprot:CAMPEP_0205808814 /NCGR_PEP_ID=MMETSP0205-20121125/12860_1 /ASSEMBLY_ACC=CAM_ASM_000278 /TAXON_ID=36767 /ORGANISM="Euplotes focardii, Strain TN1" /LENGTH=255 /DNA_ID=CAMNT_0053085053 /DNA_START=314 /DNA_END=1078 /DNA_ORIENTATION=-
MSVYSELLAWYPLGTVEKIKNKEKFQAIPPFEFIGKADAEKSLGNDPTLHGFQPVSIHSGYQTNKMLRANDYDICPATRYYARLAKEDPKFEEINKKYIDNILKSVREDWGISKTLDFASVDPFTDSYYSAMFDLRLKEEFALDNDKIDAMFADRFYQYFMLRDEVARLASTNFLAFVTNNMDAKIFAFSPNGTSDDSHLKLVLMSAHDSTLAAILSGVEQKQKVQPFYASSILIELWQKEGTEGTSGDDFYAQW